jgi:hypothetical protein
MIQKRVLDPERLRRLPKSFGWVDQRLLSEGYLGELSPEATKLYLFLALVSDREGLSFYSDRSVMDRLGLSGSQLETARHELVRHRLVIWSVPLYQLLIVPERLAGRPTPTSGPSKTTLAMPHEIRQVLGQLLKP